MPEYQRLPFLIRSQAKPSRLCSLNSALSLQQMWFAHSVGHRWCLIQKPVSRGVPNVVTDIHQIMLISLFSDTIWPLSFSSNFDSELNHQPRQSFNYFQISHLDWGACMYSVAFLVDNIYKGFAINKLYISCNQWIVHFLQSINPTKQSLEWPKVPGAIQPWLFTADCSSKWESFNLFLANRHRQQSTGWFI